MFGNAYSGKKVWLSGHTGFKGGWLAEWLIDLGAEVTGFALAPGDPGIFNQLGLRSRLNHEIGDVRDAEMVARSLRKAAPDFVFHLAAQPLVRRSYEIPVETYAVNVMGTVHILEALRSLTRPCAAVLVTTDKCYENREWLHAYREEDPMGGYDPYSSSKGMAELAIGAYRRSFFQKHPVKIASGRAGNVIGGGDWAKDRIVPDCMRALQAGQPVLVRNKIATRPWQHVLEPLSGYLSLGEALSRSTDPDAASFASAFNFGPGLKSNRTVADLVVEILKHWPGEWRDQSDPSAPHEAGRLNLATDKAHHSLGWSPAWDFSTTVAHTVAWYRETLQSPREPAKTAALTRRQIHEYAADARQRGLAWSQ